MSKLLTQAELSQMRAIAEDYTYPVITYTQVLKLMNHIDALNENINIEINSHNVQIKRADKAEAELARRDALAGNQFPVAVFYIENGKPVAKRIQDDAITNAMPVYAAPPASGIDANHNDPNLSPGEYSVNISTKGGAAIINGVPPAYNRCQYCISNDMPKCVHGSHWGKEAPAVPDELPDSDDIGEYEDGYNNGWNACRAAAMLANKEKKNG